MTRSFFYGTVASLALLALILSLTALAADQQWRQHDPNRPLPPIIDPGMAGTPDRPGKAPSDAIVLFDGTDLSSWRASDGGPAKWVVKNGNMEAVAGGGPVRTLQAFGDCQLHVEWAAPLPVQGRGQGRGNSGVFLMNTYEVQVLDSYDNVTYADGQAAAVYGQHPPQVNASRPPGQWQTYDIVFRRPHFDEAGKLVQPARVTVFHNGVLVQDDVEIAGPTTWMQRTDYRAHPDKLPISLQDHGNPVLFRNIWVRELPVGQAGEKEIFLGAKILEAYAGQYKTDGNLTISIRSEGDQLYARIGGSPFKPIFARSEKEFFSKAIGVDFEFEPGPDGKMQAVTIKHGEDRMHGERQP
jgi:hypothetical protein